MVRRTPVDEARAALRDSGYWLEFTATPDGLHCPTCDMHAHPADVVIEAVTHLAHPDGSSAGDLLALDCLSCGVKGVWLFDRTDPSARAILARLKRAAGSTGDI